MAQFRGEKIFASLSVQEQQQLAERIAGGKRKTLKILFDIVRNNVRKGRELDKKVVFKKVFGRPYSEKEDYLLRNEFRLLTGKAQDVLAEAVQMRELRSSPAVYDLALLRSLMEKKLWLEFEGIYKKALERAAGEHDYNTARLLTDMYFSYLMMNREGSYELYAESHALLCEHLRFVKALYRAETAHNQSRRIVCEHMMKATNSLVDIPVTVVGADTDFTETETPLVLFFEAKARAFRATGEERIGYARESVDKVMQLNAERFHGEQILALGNLGLTYYLDQRFGEAREYYERAMTGARKWGRTPDIALVFNYVACLMKLEHYRDVLALIKEYRSIIENTPRLHFRFECFRSFSHIFLGEPNAAADSIPPAITQRPETEYHYFRFALLAIPYLRGDVDDALREATNFAKYFHRSKSSIGLPHELDLVTMYKRFFTMVLTPSGAKKKRMISGLRSMQQDFIHSHPAYVDFLPFVWLRKQTEKEAVL
jgi:tetratricopeptide (TPR) repeat protein